MPAPHCFGRAVARLGMPFDSSGITFAARFFNPPIEWLPPKFSPQESQSTVHGDGADGTSG
jgi:hypothetical protein